VADDGCGGVRGGRVSNSAPSGFHHSGALRSPVMNERHWEGRKGAHGVVGAEKGEEKEKAVDGDGEWPLL
jgi:hypothetical protein